jgi:hypothetical protein
MARLKSGGRAVKKILARKQTTCLSKVRQAGRVNQHGYADLPA